MQRLPRFILAVLLLGAAAPASAQQVADSSFDVTVVRPAFTASHPRVLFDEAHHEFHRAHGRYLAFTRLITADGCEVTVNERVFTPAVLEAANVLVIANALGADDMGDPAAAHAAFTSPECAVVRDWVAAGGALLLIADHAPMGDAARELAAALGVRMHAAYTVDPLQSVGGNPTLIAYSEGHGLASNHPIVAGRDSSERVRRVIAFTGQSLGGPPGATSLLTLSRRAQDVLAPFTGGAIDLESAPRDSAGGRSQGLAFTFGRGRVVVLGEAAMMTAQVAGPRRRPMGMNVPGNDDRQFALNVVRWLAGMWAATETPAPAR